MAIGNSRFVDSMEDGKSSEAGSEIPRLIGMPGVEDEKNSVHRVFQRFYG